MKIRFDPACVRQNDSRLRIASASLLKFSLAARNGFYSLLFPRECPGCHMDLPYPAALCPACGDGLKKIENPYCRKCGAPMAEQWRVKRCPECAVDRSPVTRIRSAFYYEGLVRQMIHEVKYARKARYLRYFAQTMFPLLYTNFPATVDALVPVPLHRARKWERRFNQAELMAEGLSRFSGIPVWHGLRKVMQTPPQSSLSGIARRKNLRDAFQCRLQGAPPSSVILIDDIVTTGTTLRRCARTLRLAGVRRVYALTIARAVKLI